MLNIILATARPEALTAFAQALQSDKEVNLKQYLSGTEALAAVPAFAPHLVVIDSGMPDTNPLELVRKLLMINAMVNTAILSPQSEADFHEQSEGLGVLTSLPLEPGPDDASTLLQKLRRVLGRS